MTRNTDVPEDFTSVGAVVVPCTSPAPSVVASVEIASHSSSAFLSVGLGSSRPFCPIQYRTS